MLNVSVQFQTYHPDPDSEELAWDIHFWIGKYSSQVNKVFSLFRTKVTSIPFCLQTYNPKPGSNLLAWDVHFWIGKYSSQVSELENPIHCWFSPKQLNLDVVDCLLTVWGEHQSSTNSKSNVIFFMLAEVDFVPNFMVGSQKRFCLLFWLSIKFEHVRSTVETLWCVQL